MRLLVVEDDSTLREVIARALTDAGYAVDVARDGAAADHMLALEPYDLVILDLNLPRVAGLEVLARAASRNENPGSPADSAGCAR